MTYDDAAVERVARWLCEFDGGGSDPFVFKTHGLRARYYMEKAREVIALLTPPQEGNQK